MSSMFKTKESFSQLGQIALILRRHGIIVLFVMAFIALGGYYSHVTPCFETPDETWHYRYVKHLADDQGLPPLFISSDEWEQGEAHQPPLFYALGALLTKSIDTGPADSLYERNPYAALGLPHSAGNKNAVLHTEELGSPSTNVIQAVRRLRWFSVICSAATVLLTYLISLEILPQRRDIALGTTALAAFNPQFVFISAGANNDALVTALATAILYLCVRVSNGKMHPYRTPLILGLCAGLAALTKLSGLMAALLIPFAYVLHASRYRFANPWEHLGRPVLIALGGMLAICGWWYARNAIVYHDVLGMRAMQAAFSVRQEPLSLHDILLVLIESVVSYWGVFGWMNVLADEAFYTIVRILTAVGLVGLILLLAQVYWRWGTSRQYRLRPIVLLGVWVFIMLVSLVRWTQLIVGPQGRLLFPAIAAVSFFLFAGLRSWLPRRYAGGLAGLVAVFLLVVSCVAPSRYIAPAYARPQRFELEQTPESIQDLDVHFGDSLFLLGYELHDESVMAGKGLRLRLYWLALKAMPTNYTFFVQLFGRKGERIGGIDSYPGKGSYPTRLWVPGEVIADDYVIQIAPDAIAPTAGVVRVGVYTRSDMRNLEARDAHGRAIGTSPEIARVRIAPTQALKDTPQHALQVNLDDKIRCYGYDLVPRTPAPGEEWEITLYWQAMTRMPKDYTVFLHLLDSAGQKVAQLDEQPCAGDYPTRFWQVDEKVKDTHRLRLPAELPPGDYALRVGLYWLESGERLPIVDSNPPTDHMMIKPIRIMRR